MPELPEVETIKIGLEIKILNKKITNFYRSNKSLREDSEINLEKIRNTSFIKIIRRARYIILENDSNHCLLIHLGMSGRIISQNNDILQYKRQKHDHFILELNKSSIIIFNDPRRFGFIDLIHKKNIENHKYLRNLGPEPFDKNFDKFYLQNKLKNISKNIKTTIMDNKIVVGVGNIYANESLFMSGILPTKPANLLNIYEIENLIVAIQYILKKAIEAGGSSINDYVNSNGELGNFQNNFKIYGQEAKNCVQCNKIILRIIQNGRSTFFCKKCQK